MSAISAKPSKQGFDQAPRLARKAKKPAPLIDPVEARLATASEKEFREILFKDFVRFVHQRGGVVVSQPWRSPAVVLVPLGETSELEKALEALSRYKFTKLPGTEMRLAHGTFRQMVKLGIVLWRG
jgi:hypothetical protein